MYMYIYIPRLDGAFVLAGRVPRKVKKKSKKDYPESLSHQFLEGPALKPAGTEPQLATAVTKPLALASGGGSACTGLQEV
jgi:hypothetical protein